MSFTKTHYIVGGVATYGLAVYAGVLYSQSKQPAEQLSYDPRSIKLDDAQRVASFNKHAKTYDDEIGRDELFMGINLLRRWHLYKAKGNLLEIGCGTGRNFDYYGSQVKRIVAVDAAEDMVTQAAIKVQKEKKISVQQMNAHQLAFPDRTFDTVVDTFGLCSYEDPVSVLQELSRVCKPDGQILLIEHGRGSYDWINRTLDNGACQHANNWGCIWNRDIPSLLDAAGLDVTSVSRFHFGTTYLIEAKPRSVAVKKTPPVTVTANSGAIDN